MGTLLATAAPFNLHTNAPGVTFMTAVLQRRKPSLGRGVDLAHGHTHDSYRWNQIATQIRLASNCV